jgi:hypothetical protein
VINRDVKIPLDLGGMKVHGNYTISSGGLQHIGYQFAANGYSWFVFSILAGITIIRNNCNYFIS